MATPTSLPATFVAGNVLTAAQMNDLRGAFRILQLVNDYDTTGLSTTSTSLTATNASVTITPSAATSKILLIGTIFAYRNTTVDADVYFAFDRGGSTVGEETRFTAARANARTNTTFVYLDSPATTSALTYTLEWRVSSGTGAVENAHSITALEVSA